MKVLWITGAGGLVGSKLVVEAAKLDYFEQIYAFTHRPLAVPMSFSNVIWSVLDVSNRDAVEAAAHVNVPDVIINSAAMTNVDACELRRYEAQSINSSGPRHLAEVSYQYDAHLIQISTDYIFPGDDAEPGPYPEDSNPLPINFYGQTKLESERAVLRICEGKVPYTIVRTALVYGLVPDSRPNFVTWLLSELGAGRRVRIVRDQWSTPTPADYLASALLWIAVHNRTGIYHVAGPDLLGRDEWACIIARHFGLDIGLIDWVKTSELGQIAKRPRFGGLLCKRLQDDFVQGAPLQRGVVEGLVDVDWRRSLYPN